MNRRVIVVGGGISGLAAAYRLSELSREKEMGLEVMLLEGSQRLGGAIATEQIGDFLLEAGPDSFLSEKPWALQLCERLGITPRLTPTNTSHQRLYVAHGGSLEPLPEGFFLLAPTRLWPFINSRLFTWRGKFRIALELLLPRGDQKSDESFASFVRRRFGAEVLERVAQPLMAGIYAADPEHLSLAATMPRFLEMERTRRSVIWAMWSEKRQGSQHEQKGSGARWSLFVTLAGGMQELVDTLASHLPPGTVHLGTKVAGLQRDSTKNYWLATTSEGNKYQAQGVILALPAYSSAEILSPLAHELSQELKAIPYSSTATVNLGYRQPEVRHPLDGFGVIVPRVESRKIIACSFSSVKFPGRAPQGHTLLRAFVGGALQPSLLEQDDAAMELSVRQELATLVGVRAAPLFCRIYRHPRSMPQYLVGHKDRVQRIEAHLARFPSLAVAGNAYHGVGIPDCIHSGEQGAEKVFAEL